MNDFIDCTSFISFIVSMMAMRYRNRFICWLFNVKEVAKKSEYIGRSMLIGLFVFVFCFAFFYANEGWRTSCFFSYFAGVVGFFLAACLHEFSIKKCVVKDA